MTVRLAALGDSITLGMGDPSPAGGWRGFAALLAQSLGEQVEFHNFGRSGALTADVLTDQLPRALQWRPDIATVVIGVNDTLRGSFDVTAIGERLHSVVDGLRGIGAKVVTACLPEPGRMLRLPAALARPLSRRIGAVNDIVHALSHRDGVVHAHVGDDLRVFDRRMWSIDRLHPSERGHRLLASLCHQALAASGRPVGTAPSLEPANPPPSRGAQIWWIATKGTRWMVNRSTDLLPQLVSLAATERQLTRRGLSGQLDLLMAREVEMVLAATGLTPAQGQGQGRTW